MTGILSSIILLGALQGLIVSGLLVYSAHRDPAGAQSKRLLAALIFLLALACLNLYLVELPALRDTAWMNLWSALLPMVVVMPMGPLVYFYIRSCVEPDFRLGRRHRVHFYSVAIDLFPHFLTLLFLIGLITGVIRNQNNHFGVFLDDYDQYADIPRWLSLVIYLWVSGRYLRNKKAAWPRSLLRVFAAFSILWLVHLIPYELPRYSNALIDRFDWYPLYLPIVLLIYWLGIKGYFISYRTGIVPRPPVARPALLPEIVAPVVAALTKAMEEDKCWLDPALSLALLAQHCRIAPKTLSAVLNQHLEKPFHELVNEYRIAAVKARLLQPESRELTIAGIAYECGFNSLPTFQRAFKSITGGTPKEFLQKNAVPLEKAEKL